MAIRFFNDKAVVSFKIFADARSVFAKPVDNEEKNKNMNELIVAIITLVLSGLAFVTYKHPEISRKILGVILAIILFLFFILNFYYLGQQNFYTSFSKSKNEFFSNYKIFSKNELKRQKLLHN